MTQNLSPEFPMSIDPVHVGVYIAKAPELGGDYYSLWDGFEWKAVQLEIDAAYKERLRSRSAYLGHITCWQGLAENPNLEGFHV